MPSQQGGVLRAIIFDLDGLMVDSEPLARQAWEQVVAAYGRVLDDAVYTQVIGRRLEDSSRIIQENLALPASPAELARQKQAIWQEIWTRGVPAMPGLMALHEEIAQRAIPWAVATSSHREYALGILQQLGLTAACGAIAAGDEVENGKPAPDLYLLAAQRLGTPPAQCLALEDSVPGCRAAVAAGMTAVAIPNNHTTAVDFPFAHYLFDSLSDFSQQLTEFIHV